MVSVDSDVINRAAIDINVSELDQGFLFAERAQLLGLFYKSEAVTLSDRPTFLVVQTKEESEPAQVKVDPLVVIGSFIDKERSSLKQTKLIPASANFGLFPDSFDGFGLRPSIKEIYGLEELSLDSEAKSLNLGIAGVKKSLVFPRPATLESFVVTGMSLFLALPRYLKQLALENGWVYYYFPYGGLNRPQAAKVNRGQATGCGAVLPSGDSLLPGFLNRKALNWLSRSDNPPVGIAVVDEA
jgi:hypothetical protein